ncbi:MAG: hypothetical protein ACI92E_001284 [Oceanicoccus sp.]|jgi:hypothetical protein
MNYRMGEVTNNHFRNRRFFCISGEWYFSTRENLKVGPFPDKEEAEIELMFFLRHVDEGGIYAVMAPERAAASLHSFSSVF